MKAADIKVGHVYKVLFGWSNVRVPVKITRAGIPDPRRGSAGRKTHGEGIVLLEPLGGSSLPQQNETVQFPLVKVVAEFTDDDEKAYWATVDQERRVGDISDKLAGDGIEHNIKGQLVLGRCTISFPLSEIEKMIEGGKL